MQLGDYLKTKTQDLKQAGIDDAAADARLLVCHALNIAKEDSIKHPERELTTTEIAACNTLLDRREQREPVSRIIGKREFWGLEFEISPATLDPRPDSETLINAALKLIGKKSLPLRILDLGTGSGCLLLSLLSELPNATGVGVDIQTDAVITAQKNAENLGLSDRAEFVTGKWGEPVQGFFDLIISNPPYIPTRELDTLAPEVKDFDPRLALDGGDDGLEAFRQLGPHLRRLLAKNGLVLLEVGTTHDNPARFLIDHELQLFGAENDLSGQVRCLFFRHQDDQEGNFFEKMPQKTLPRGDEAG